MGTRSKPSLADLYRGTRTRRHDGDACGAGFTIQTQDEAADARVSRAGDRLRQGPGGGDEGLDDDLGHARDQRLARGPAAPSVQLWHAVAVLPSVERQRPLHRRARQPVVDESDLDGVA